MLFRSAAAADSRLQAALAFVDAFYASEALVLTKLNERYALEDFEAAINILKVGREERESSDAQSAQDQNN